MKIRLFVQLLCLLILSSCSFFLEDDPFSLVQTPNTSSALRIDGYYYNYVLNDTNVFTQIFYSNGIILQGNWSESMNSIETDFTSGEFYNRIKDTKFRWGLYVINGDKISYEYLVPTGGLHLIANIWKGEILNDSTIHLSTSAYTWENSGVKKIDGVMHFKKFSPKPDSINVFFP